MRYDWLDNYCRAKPGATFDHQPDWNWDRYKVGEKLFLAICKNGDEPYYITLKLPPEEGEMLRKLYPDVLPGYYMNHLHWNSIRADGELPDELLRELVDRSYATVLSAFSKRKQAEIVGESGAE